MKKDKWIVIGVVLFIIGFIWYASVQTSNKLDYKNSNQKNTEQVFNSS